jgi:hypothetical protein
MLLPFGLHTTAPVLATPERTCHRCGAGAARGRRDRADVHTFFIQVCRAGGARSLNTCTVCGLETELSKPHPLGQRLPAARRAAGRPGVDAT